MRKYGQKESDRRPPAVGAGGVLDAAGVAAGGTFVPGRGRGFHQVHTFG